jgi:hypothetical protein
MRRMMRSRAMLGLVVLAGAFATAPPARAQMCAPAVNDCETQANVEARRCSFQCQRYDTICADRCDDTYDTVVRYCWIKAAFCKASEQSQAVVKASSQRQ